MKLFWLILIFFLTQSNYIYPGFSFSSKDSKIHIGKNAGLIVNKNMDDITGTLEFDYLDATRVSGASTITFSGGILGNTSANARFTGLYDPASLDTLFLQGTQNRPHFLNVISGTIDQGIFIEGQYNSILGQPFFSNNIVLDGDSLTTLTVGIQSKLNKTIELKSGSLILEDDLNLADDTIIFGPGSIYLNNKSLHLSGATSTWSDKLHFFNATDIRLHSKTYLTENWTFSGEGVLNGNGCVLEFDGGNLVVAPNSILHINDIMIKNFGLGCGGFIMLDDDSQIVFSHVAIEMEATYTTSVGNIYVDGIMDVISKGYEWWFAQNGSLSIDGVTIWVDGAGAAGPKGLGIKFEDPKAAHYESISSGTIKTVREGTGDYQALTDLVLTFSDAIANNSEAIVVHETEITNNSYAIINNYDMIVNNSYAIINTWNLAVSNSDAMHQEHVLTQSPLTHDVTFDESLHVNPGKFIEVAGDITLNGQGAFLDFTYPNHHQFIINEGKSVTLENMVLRHISNGTFDFGNGSKVKIGENITWELSDDITLTMGQIEILGESNTFVVEGIGGDKRRLKFTAAQCTSGCHMGPPIRVNLGYSTMVLKNIELIGLEHIDGSMRLRDRYLWIVGAIGLCGDTIVNVNHGTKMNFVAEGLNNTLVLLENDLLFAGSLLFGNMFDNELHIKFLLEGEIARYPRVVFGNDFALLTSMAGWARLLFDDAYVQVKNETANAFIVSDRSFLGGHRLEILSNPIKQVSRDFCMQFGMQIVSDQPNAIEQEFVRSPFTVGRTMGQVSTALHLGKIYNLSEELIVPQDIRALGGGGKAWYPTNVDLEVNYNTVQLSQAANTIRMDNGTIYNFGTHPVDSLDLTMLNKSKLEQKKQPVELKFTDGIKVEGKDNKIIVNDRMLINGDLILRENSQLIFEFSDTATAPEVYFSSLYANQLTIPKGARLVFTGKGTVKFQDGYTIQFGDTLPRAELVFDDAAELTLDGNATLQVAGKGKILVDDNAKIRVDQNQHFIVGQSLTDDIQIKIDREGAIEVDSLRDTSVIDYNVLSRKAKMSMQLASYAFDVTREGTLWLGKGGMLEINALDNVEKRGKLSSFTFQDAGALRIDEGGLLVMGRNVEQYIRGPETTFSWDNIDGQLIRNGLVGFVATEFVGQMQTVASNMVSLIADDFVDLFINQMPSLFVSSLFTDGNGIKKVRTKNKIIVELISGDEVIEDDSISGDITVINDGELFTITADGQRI